jgi:hypothetical protein
VTKYKEPANFWYVLLVALGIVFLITACAYGTMAYRAITPQQATGEAHPLMQFLDVHGMELLGGELGLLAIATCGAMWLDTAREKRRAQRDKIR